MLCRWRTSTTSILVLLAAGCWNRVGAATQPEVEQAPLPPECLQQPSPGVEPNMPAIDRATAIRNAREALQAWPQLKSHHYPAVDFTRPVSSHLYDGAYHVVCAGKTLLKGVNRFFAVAVVDAESGAVVRKYINAI